jgi:hypothetical protein
MAINFPDSPVVNQEFTSGSRTWIWDGSVWNSKETVAALLSATAPITYNATTQAVGIDQSQLASVSGNAIINGAFEINQRGFTSSVVNGAIYGFDRWRKVNLGDGTGTFSAQVFTLGSAPVQGYEGINFQRIVTSGQSSANVASFVEQKIEDVRTFAGQTVTASFFAKAGSGAPQVTVELNQDFGIGGSSAVSVSPTKIQISTGWARYSATFQIPSIAGKTLGSNHHLRANFWVSAGADNNLRTDSMGIQNNTFDVWGVQLEAGSVATPFKRNAPSIQGELAACQRYYFRETFTGVFGQGSAPGTSLSDFLITFPVSMRVPPTSVEVSNISSYRVQSAADVTAGSWTLALPSSSRGTLRNSTGLSSFTTGETMAVRCPSGTGFIGIGAEL